MNIFLTVKGKTVFLVFLIMIELFAFNKGYSQQPGNNSVASLKNSEAYWDTLGIKNVLIDLALKNYPEMDMYQLNVYGEDVDIKQERWNWLNDLSGSFNLNEGNIANDVNSNLYFPRYNFRFNVSVGTIVLTPGRVKKAKIEKQIAEKELATQSITIAREVLLRYQEFLLRRKLFMLKSRTYEDISLNFTSVSRSFQNGEIKLEDYSEALLSKNTAMEEKLLAEHALIQAKTNLEALIGASLESVIDL